GAELVADNGRVRHDAALLDGAAPFDDVARDREGKALVELAADGAVSSEADRGTVGLVDPGDRDSVVTLAAALDDRVVVAEFPAAFIIVARIGAVDGTGRLYVLRPAQQGKRQGKPMESETAVNGGQKFEHR